MIHKHGIFLYLFRLLKKTLSQQYVVILSVHVLCIHTHSHIYP